ncbi:MAG: hypothetical protein GY875_19050 [Gammaproteobacteria bacterium]|nr:hypothetical protein [Gammaproteobacteria bacterium]
MPEGPEIRLAADEVARALVARLKREGLTRREEHRFNSYGRAGQACHFCGSTIEVSNAGGRKMYYCPGCQPSPSAGKNRGCD